MSKAGTISNKNKKYHLRLREKFNERSRRIQESKQWEKDWEPLKSNRLKKKVK